MNALTVLLVPAIPLCAGLLLALIGHRPRASRVNLAVSVVTLGAAAALAREVVEMGPATVAGGWFFVDPLNVFLVCLTAFVGTTTAAFSADYMAVERQHGRMTPRRMRLYHAMYQVFIGMMFVALLTNNMGILWVAMEAATLSTVVLVSVYRTAASLEAAWKYFILCGVGIAQALFGTILLFLAADRVMGPQEALRWTALLDARAQLDPAIVSLAFVFLLLGYGTKVGLAPVHNWLPDAHAEGPTPISAVLSGLLLNVALYAVLRCKVVAEGAVGSALPGGMMIGFGLLSLLLAAFSLFRQRDIKRLFAYSSIEHMGLITFAFGMGGAVGNFAGLLHMTAHSLVKSGIFFVVGHTAQQARSQVMEDIRGLVVSSPPVGWSLVLGTFAILGLPPFAIFASEFLILTAAMKTLPWAAPLLLLGLGVAFAAIFACVKEMAFGEPPAASGAMCPVALPAYLHLALALVLGLYIPPYLLEWYRAAARMLGG